MSKILIVEDDPIISRMYAQALEFERHEVVVAFDGEEGYEKVSENNPTIILLDVMMPKMNGFELLDKLKGDLRYKNIPVVMLTNLSENKDAENALLKGAVKYIIKGDNTPKQVVEMVKEIINAYSRGDMPAPVVKP